MLVRVADDIRVRAAGQVEPFDDAQVREQVQGPKDGRSADLDALAPASLEKIGGREMAAGARHELRDKTPVGRGLIPCPFECPDYPFGLVHLILSLSGKSPDDTRYHLRVSSNICGRFRRWPVGDS